MQDSYLSPQSERLFGKRRLHWAPLDRADLPRLKIPDHLEDQVFSVQAASSPDSCFFEFLVSEQCPKDAYAHFGHGVSRLGARNAAINVIHGRSANGHLIFWRRAQRNVFHHMDVDFRCLSRFDRAVIKRLNSEEPHAMGRLFELLEGQALDGRAFFRTLRKQLRQIPCPDQDAYYAVVDLCLKLVFLIFVQRKGWLNFDPFYLERKMTDCHDKRLSIVACFFKPLFARLEGARVFEPLALGELPRLGGGMFQFEPERLPPIANDWCLELYRTLVSKYSFSLFEARKNRRVVGVSPEALGYVFENLLAADDRKRQGVFYTPAETAEKQVKFALDAYLDAAPGGKRALRRRLAAIRVLDPSCGSGTYLVAAFQALLKRRLALAPAKERYNGKLYALKRAIVLENLYGVDINPMAIRLAEVRLWLNMIQDLEIAEPAKAPALPSLQHHLRAGDFLGQHKPSNPQWIAQWPKREILEGLRRKFPHCSTRGRQASLKHIHRLERELYEYLRERERAQRRAAVKTQLAQTTLPGCDRDPPDRRGWRQGEAPAAFLHILFSETMMDGGFDMIVGNPPWMSASRLPAAQKQRILASLQGPPELKLGGQVDLSVYFTAAALELIKPNGHLSLLLPGKVLQSRYAAALRRYLQDHWRIDYLFDYGLNQRLLFQADTFPLALGVTRRKPRRGDEVRVALYGKRMEQEFMAPQATLSEGGDVWPLGAAAEMKLLALVRDWPRLKQRPLRIERGVVTGAKRHLVFDKPPSGAPRSRLRPLLRGRDIQENRVSPSQWIYWPFDAGADWSESLADVERQWLKRAGRLNGRELKLGYRPRRMGPWIVAWKYLSARWTATLYRGPWIPDQTTYFISFDRFEDAFRYAAFFNSDTAAALLQSLAERGKDDCRFYYAHTCGELPLPPDLETRPLATPPPCDLFTPAELRRHGRIFEPLEEAP